jgi:hypothetical protein
MRNGPVGERLKINFGGGVLQGMAYLSEMIQQSELRSCLHDINIIVVCFSPPSLGPWMLMYMITIISHM